MQEAIDVDYLDQLGRAKLVKEFRNVDCAGPADVTATGPPRTSTHETLQPLLLPLELCVRFPLAPCLLQLACHLAKRC